MIITQPLEYCGACLVSVVPPGHDRGVLVRVLPEPVVRLTEVIEDVTTAEKGIDIQNINIVFGM